MEPRASIQKQRTSAAETNQNIYGDIIAPMMNETTDSLEQPELEIAQADEVEDIAETGQPRPNKPDDTITFKRSHLYSVLLPLAFVAGLSVGYIFWGRSSSTPPGTAAPQTNSAGSVQSETPTGEQSQKITRYDIPIDDDPALGPENAPITIIEFSDYECPYCRQWHEAVYHRLFETYPDQVRLVYRDFPLYSVHPNAVPAAEAADCANEQGAFWDYHDKLFGMELGLSSEAYQQYAEELDLDMDAFNTCVETRKYREEVQADYTFASNLGVRSTPTFFVNGIALVGAQPFEVFQEVIDKELAGELD
jgi:protein-disulfide isomerase